MGIDLGIGDVRDYEAYKELWKELDEIEVRCVEKYETCKHSVGDSFVYKNPYKRPAGLCEALMHVLDLYLWRTTLGFPSWNDADPKTYRIHCPDAKGTVWEMRKLPKREVAVANREICARAIGAEIDSIERKATGLSGRVYLVTAGARSRIVKISEDAKAISGSLYWLERLAPLGLPIPKIERAAYSTPPYYCVMSFVPGVELGDAYSTLSSPEKKAIAAQMVDYQSRVHAMPEATGYGFLHSYDDELNSCLSWGDVVRRHINRSEGRIQANGYFSADYVAAARELLPSFDGYFARVPARAFLDDATTKNVLVERGRITGIVDLDWLCFGDALYAIALTAMSLLDKGYDLTYVDEWKRLARISEEEERAFRFYLLVFCLDFMSEKGMRFNKEKPDPVTENERSRLEGIFNRLYANLRDGPQAP